MKKNTKKKGFTLVELIAVIAILGILAAVAVPNFTNLQNSSKIKADATTAAQIVKSARIQETDTGVKVSTLTQSATPASGELEKSYMTIPTPQSGGTFVLSGGGSDPYIVKWTPTAAGTFTKEQTVTEGVLFEINK